jgi:protein-L-isoaspartate(D-aspartate) O-methyltransferase
VPDELADRAYADGALPSPAGQTISQPYIVALMIEALALTGTERVLDIGTGSGYAAAVLSRLAAEVYTIERHAALVDYARGRFEQLQYINIHIMHGDGTLGWPEHAPYDAILVSASGPGVPAQLKQQLAPRGRIVMPVGSDDDYSQYLIRETRESEDRFRREYLGQVRFVPLTARRAGRTICLCMTDMAFYPTTGGRKINHRGADKLCRSPYRLLFAIWKRPRRWRPEFAKKRRNWTGFTITSWPAG